MECIAMMIIRMTPSNGGGGGQKDLLMPYAGVRGKSGGLNFAVDLLQFRDGFIGTGADADPVPDRMLFGIFDARHQPHPDFWRKCLPKFTNNTALGYTYEATRETKYRRKTVCSLSKSIRIHKYFDHHVQSSESIGTYGF